MKWSKYQNEVFRSDNENILVNAVAGSGKSTVIEECISRKPPSPILASAFNKHIGLDLSKRMEHMPHVTVKTLNAFGYTACRNELGFVKINKNKVFNILKYKLELPEPWKLRRNVERVISLLKANLIKNPTEQDVQNILDDFNITVKDEDKFIKLIFEVFELCLEQKKVMDFDDQIFFPLYYGWDIPQFERIYIDEAQDLTPGQIELTARASGSYCYVGDPRQAIYQFRGADSNAIPNIIARLACRELPLSVCYRCPQAVVEEAQKIVPHLEWFKPGGILNSIKKPDYLEDDMVLCRTTAPLVEECLKCIRDGKKAMVLGREIGDSLKDLTRFADSNIIMVAMENIDRYYQNKAQRLRELKKGDALQRLEDIYETVCVLAEESETVEDLNKTIDTIFSDKVSGIKFMTIHKSKGLQNPRVFLLRPDLIPHKRAETEEQLLAEDNLKYVGLTRSQEEFYYVE